MSQNIALEHLHLFAVAVEPNALDPMTGNCDDPRASGCHQETV
jgi:hypothetical protein